MTLYFGFMLIVGIWISVHIQQASEEVREEYYIPLIFIVGIFEVGSIIALFCSHLILGAFINHYFETHELLLKKTNLILGDLYRMGNIYFGDNPIKPRNYIYSQAIKILNYTHELKEEKLKTLKDILSIVKH